MADFLGGWGGGENETRDLAGPSLHFATPPCFQFCHVLLCVGGLGGRICNLQFVTPVGMVCYSSMTTISDSSSEIFLQELHPTRVAYLSF